MCIYSQTQYLACGHNIESLTEMCELGKEFKPSMHDKVIIGLHTSNAQCERCNPNQSPVSKVTPETIDLTGPASSPTPESKLYPDLIDLTKDRPQSNDARKRRDSMGEDMDVN